MSIHGSLKYSFTRLLSVLLIAGAFTAGAQPVADTAAVADSNTSHPAPQGGHQLALGIDIVRPIINANSTDKYGLEFAADYYLKNELYLAS